MREYQQRVVLASGGIDSYLTWALFAQEAPNIFVDIDQPYYGKEHRALQSIAKFWGGAFRFVTAPGPSMREHVLPSGIIPMRNAELIIAASHYGDAILLGVLADEINSDKSPDFMVAITSVLNVSWRKQYWNQDIRPRVFNAYSPIRAYTKARAVAEYLDRRLPVEPLFATVSCYNGATAIHCGACPSCYKRWVALKLNGLMHSFAEDPRDYMTREGIFQKAHDALAAHAAGTATDATYSVARATEILEAGKMR